MMRVNRVVEAAPTEAEKVLSKFSGFAK